MARSTELLGSVLLTKWNTSTIRTARPRTPSSTGMCPRRLGRQPPLADAEMPDIGAPPGFGGGVKGACADISLLAHPGLRPASR